MMPDTSKKAGLLKVTLMTGMAFLLAGSIKSPLFQAYGEENFLQIVLVIILSYLFQGVIGCYVLAWLLRDQYPIKRLWIICVGSILIGISIPVLLFSQFFFTLLFVPYILIGFVLGIFLKGKSQTVLSCGIGGLLANAYFMLAGNLLQPLILKINDTYGVWLSSMVVNGVPDFLLGASIALGIALLRAHS